MRNNTIKRTIERLREILPPLLTLEQYCRVRSCGEASAYNDLKNKPGIAVKCGFRFYPAGSTDVKPAGIPI
jgi:hypothetical protein